MNIDWQLFIWLILWIGPAAAISPMCMLIFRGFFRGIGMALLWPVLLLVYLLFSRKT